MARARAHVSCAAARRAGDAAFGGVVGRRGAGHCPPPVGPNDQIVRKESFLIKNYFYTVQNLFLGMPARGVITAATTRGPAPEAALHVDQ
jgi:hypothetical protein